MAYSFVGNSQKRRNAQAAYEILNTVKDKSRVPDYHPDPRDQSSFYINGGPDPSFGHHIKC
jgi:hypothetical protein